MTIACDHGDKTATCSLHVDDGGWSGTTTYPVHSYAVTVTATETGSSSDTSSSSSAIPSGTTWTSSSAAPTSPPTSTPTEGAGAEETDGPGNGAIGHEAGMSFAAGVAAVVMGVAAAVL